MKFTKAHALGNDFVLVGASDCPPEAGPWARRLCDRHRGVGADGVLVYRREEGVVVMRLINADGGDAEISGNGVRCLAAHMVRQGLLPSHHVVRTVPGPRPVEVEALGASRFRVTSDLGEPRLESLEIPVALDPPRPSVVDHPLEVRGREVRITAASFGNPHCAIFLESPPDDALLAALGPALETHPFFPHRTNVEFVSVRARDEIRARFWERGVGVTLASGTGAASAAVAAVLNGRAERRLRVVCDGGVLEVDWAEDGPLRQVGEVEILFDGEWLIP